MKTVSHHRDLAGLTLPEVVTALAVILMGVSATLITVTMANKTAKASVRQMDAVHGARAQLEDLRRYAFNDPMLSAGSHTIGTNWGFNGSYFVTTINTNLKSIRMSIMWTNALTRATATASVATIFSKAMH